MRTVRAEAPARVALAGNPSDGYGGAVLALAIANYRARVTVYEWPRLEIVPAPVDGVSFGNLGDLVADVEANGYYGGLRLVKAALHRLALERRRAGAPIDERTFSVRYETTIPRGVGLGGSSAIVIATLRAVAGFCGVRLTREELAPLALTVETEELGIAAGLQDRVAQSFGGLTFMDFGDEPARGRPYEQLDPGGLPPLFVAHLASAAEPSHEFHSRLRARVEAGDRAAAAGLEELAASAERARAAARACDGDAVATELRVTYEARRRLAPLDPRHVELVEIAERCGSEANFSGSGGAVVGRYRDDAHLAELERAYAEAGCELLRCSAAPTAGGDGDAAPAGRDRTDQARRASGSAPDPGPPPDRSRSSESTSSVDQPNSRAARP